MFPVSKEPHDEDTETGPETQQSQSFDETTCLSSQVPKRWSNQSLNVFCLIVAVITVMLTASPLLAWQALEPMLLEVNLFYGSQAQLDALFVIAMSLLLIMSLPAGLLYDWLGAPASCCIGSTIATTGLLLMSKAVTDAPVHGYLMWIGYPTATLGGSLIMSALFPYIWVFPESQNLVLGINGAALSLSTTVAFAAVWLHGFYGLPLSRFLYFLAITSAVSAGVWWVVLPSQRDTMQLAEKVMGKGALPPPVGLSAIPKAWALICQYPLANLLVVLFITLFLFAFQLPVQHMLWYYSAIFSKGTAEHLTSISALIFGPVGSIATIAGGATCDSIGVEAFMYLLTAFNMVPTLILLVPTVTAQYVAQVAFGIIGNFHWVIVGKTCMMYATPDLFGTYSGLLFTTTGFIILLCMLIIDPIIMMNDSITTLKIAYCLAAAASTISGVFLSIYWWLRPPPSLGASSAS